ncbi:MAG: biotin--[acetyl-CoA-carboxylase] ligase [Lactobacillaceae bacterium]|jgi:BirA family biotin operon repressor/biotin-[acetyl-CoA-carboxylase] ligase|nr:biotin--[acetyl-CoA-carboxylase] ligase [Lactobacillaceae bacterium]
MKQEKILAELTAVEIKVQVNDTVTSTNLLAKAELDTNSLTGPKAFIASQQTAGYGRRGREFYSPKRGVYITMAIPLEMVNALKPGLITTGLIVKTAKVIQAQFSVPVQIKWVNDLYLHDLKVGGMLVEVYNDAMIIGLGLNVNTTAFPAELQGKAGFITTNSTEYEALGGQILAAWLAYFKQPDLDILTQYRQLSYVLNKEVTLQYQKEVLTGQAVDITADGSLVLDINGELQEFNTGEVTKVLTVGGNQV